MFPKTLFVDILENTDKTDVGSYEDNVHIVSYRSIERGKRNYGVSGYDAPSLIAPLQTFRSLYYWNLESYAHAIVMFHILKTKEGLLSGILTQLTVRQSSEMLSLIIH